MSLNIVKIKKMQKEEIILSDYLNKTNIEGLLETDKVTHKL